METEATQLLILGGGPGGYVAALRAAQLGLRTTLVEGDQLGGTCLNIGCIPSKALIHVADHYAQARHWTQGSALGISVGTASLDITRTVAWKDGIVRRLTGGVAALLKKHGVQVVHGWGRVVDGKSVEVRQGDGGTRVLRCEHLLLACGSTEVELPALPFGGKVISSTQALSPTALPQSLVVVGGGYIGLELGTVYAKWGVRVTVVEAQPRILPGYDDELTRPVATSLRKLGVTVLTGSRVLGLDGEGSVRVQTPDGTEQALPCDQVLVAVGRQPRTQGWGLENLPLDRRGRALTVDDQCRTPMRQVWAIGDLTGEPMLAHRAMAQGEMVAELIAGRQRHFAPEAIPAVCYTDPEVVTAGLSPDAAAAAGVDCQHASFPFAANGRALTLEGGDGFVRVVARRDNQRIVGWQAVGRGVSELAAAFGQSLEMGACLEDVAHTIHAHPTLGEAVQEACLRALGHALHI